MAARPHDPPVNRSRHLGLDELIFSSSDEKGRIRDGNQVFARVAGRPLEEMLGAPHNILRHPDMPRGVFRLFWQRMHAGLPAAAYVKNISRDGRYYWVIGVTVPTPQGFMSVRLKPSSPHFNGVPELYAQLREAERELEAAGENHRDVAEAGQKMLMDTLAGAGFPDYASFERVILPAEISSREQHLALAGIATNDDNDVLRALGATAASLTGLFAHVSDYQQRSHTLEASSRTVRRLADDVRLNAINGLVAARRLSSDGSTLSVVADRMTHAAHDIADIVARLDEDLAPAVADMGELAFRISTAKLQIDMARAYAREAHTNTTSGPPALEELAGCLVDSNTLIADTVTTMRTRLGRIAGTIAEVERTLANLTALHMCGRIEVAAVPHAHAFRVLLDDVKVQLDAGTNEVKNLRATANHHNGPTDDLDQLVEQTRGMHHAVLAHTA